MRGQWDLSLKRELLTKRNPVESNQIFSRGLNCFPVFYLASCYTNL